jgi:hypothetical protein
MCDTRPIHVSSSENARTIYRRFRVIDTSRFLTSAKNCISTGTARQRFRQPEHVQKRAQSESPWTPRKLVLVSVALRGYSGLQRTR